MACGMTRMLPFARCELRLCAAVLVASLSVPGHAATDALSEKTVNLKAAAFGGGDCRLGLGMAPAPQAAAAELPNALERMRILQERREAEPAAAAPAASACSEIAAFAASSAAAMALAADPESELGTTAIPVDRTRFDDRWERVRRAPPASLMRTELQRAGVSRGLAETEILQRVNQWVNRRIAYVNDDRNYRQGDFWATAEQTIARGSGDCEDFAILKMQMLLAAGIDGDRVKLVLLRDLAVNADHAFLLVQGKTGKLVLDNMTDQLYDGSQPNAVRPILSFSGARRWVHGYRDADPVPATAALPAARLTTVSGKIDRSTTKSPVSLALNGVPKPPVRAGFHSIRLSMVDYRRGSFARTSAFTAP
jgi:predicted transglutaminase-like cysteine proteinase